MQSPVFIDPDYRPTTKYKVIVSPSNETIASLKYFDNTIFPVDIDVLSEREKTISQTVHNRIEKNTTFHNILLFKTVFDFIIASALLSILMPLLLVVAIIIKLYDSGPVFIRQERTGLNGKTFSIYKFRTMIKDAHKDRAAGHATKDDNRITPVGQFLRKTSIDELPQLFNVLKGEMALVGPRPHMISHDTHYMQTVPMYALRFRVKPGLTGLAQIRGYRGMVVSNHDMVMRASYDNAYVDQWSVFLDIIIMMRTIPAVLKGNNAH